LASLIQMKNEIIIRVLTIGSLAGLLTAVGMRLKLRHVVDALRRRHLAFIVMANFVVVPVLALGAAKLGRFSPEISIGIMRG
jgi:BASS family bile acid:Na+ symporter